MIRTMLLAVSAGLLSCASFAQVPGTVTSPNRLTDGGNDRVIKLDKAAAKVTPAQKKGTVIYGPCNDRKPWLYSLTPTCPLPAPQPLPEPVPTPVTPAPEPIPVPTPAPAPQPEPAPAPVPAPTPAPAPTPLPNPSPVPTAGVTALSGDELFTKVRDTVFGGNSYGGLGTAGTAPAAFRSAGEKFGRKAFFSGGVDLIVAGAPIDAHTIAYKVAGKAYLIANTGLNLSGAGAVGTWSKGGTWTGQMGCIRKVRAFSFEADGYLLTENLTNTCAQPVTDLRSMIAQDPDNGDTGEQGVTTNKIVARGTLTAKLASGRTYSLATDDARFVAAVAPNLVTIGGRSSYVFTKPDAVKPQSVGYSMKADSDLILISSLGDLAPGASTSVTFVVGVADR